MLGAAGSGSAPSGNMKKKKSKGGGATPPETPKASKEMMTSIGLAGMKKEALIQAEEEEAKMAEGASLSAMIGDVLTRKKYNLDQLVREWDVMGSGEITLVEFRKSLRWEV